MKVSCGINFGVKKIFEKACFDHTKGQELNEGKLKLKQVRLEDDVPNFQAVK